MNKNGSILSSCLLDKTDNRVNHILVKYVLYVGLSPIEGEEAHALDNSIIIGVSSCAIDDMRDLV